MGVLSIQGTFEPNRDLSHTVYALEHKLKDIYEVHKQIHNNEPYKVDTETGSITAFEPVKVSINFVSENTNYTDYGGFVFLHDVIGKDERGQLFLQDLAKDMNFNGVFDGIESGIMKPIFTEYDVLNGTPLVNGNGSITPASIVVLPDDVVTPYIDVGYGVNPIARNRFRFTDLLTGATSPDNISVTDNGNGQYEVVWHDGKGDVNLRFTVERIPFYKQEYKGELQKVPSSNNPFAVQVGDAVVQISKDVNENTNLEIYALDTLEDYRIKIGDNEIKLETVEKGSNQTFNLGFIDDSEPVSIEIIAPEPQTAEQPTTPLGTAVIQERGIIGYDTKTITFGDQKATFNIPVLDLTNAVTLNFGKYERVMPNGQTILATVPASVSGSGVSGSVDGKYYELLADNIAIEDPGKPVKPNKADFINPETGELDKEAYSAAVAQYKEALAEYKTAAKTYKAAVKAAKLVDKGQKKSLKVEQKAIKTVNKALAKLVKGEKKADKYITKAEVSLEKAANYREQAQQLRKEANEALRAKGWTINNLNNILANKPVKSNYSSKEEYAAAKAEYKEAKAIAKLFKKADKYDLKADKLEAKAERYQQKAISITAKTVDKFKTTLEKLIDKYSSKADNLRATGEGLLEQTQNLTGVDYYKALGKGVYKEELAEGYARGAEIATAVLDAFVSVDVSVNPGVAESLSSVDISSVNVSI